MLQSSQLDLFRIDEPIAPEINHVDYFWAEHRDLFQFLLTNIQWDHKFQSRKTAMFGVSYGDDGDKYTFNHLPDFLIPLRDKIHECFGYQPNSCLINNYPSGGHYISYHSDKNMEMNQHTGVAIVSLGTMREMAFRKIQDPNVKCYYALQPGSALYMDDKVQASWQHGVPKTQRNGHRISLSFRSLVVQ